MTAGARRQRRPPAHRVTYVVDARGWVAEHRLPHLQRALEGAELALATPSEFSRAWLRGELRDTPVYFSTWRTLRDLAADGRCRFDDADLGHVMASVTSHQYVGGGLRPETAVPAGSNESAVLAEAVDLLRRLRVVTVNSIRLRDLLSPHVPGLLYAPNGVDARFFTPARDREFDPASVRVGWVGRVRAAKNHEAIVGAFAGLERLGIRTELLAIPKGDTPPLDPKQMRGLFRRLDFYVCASWHEGTPNPALEAAACGVPLVTTRVGNMPELVRDGVNGYFVEPTVESLIATLAPLRSLSPAGYGRMSTAIRDDIVAEWTWEHALEAYRVAFNRLLDQGGSTLGETG